MQSEKFSPFLDMTSMRATALSEAFIRRTTSINASLSSSYVVLDMRKVSLSLFSSYPNPVRWLVWQQRLSGLRPSRDEVWCVGRRTGGAADPFKILTWQCHLRTATLHIMIRLPP